MASALYIHELFTGVWVVVGLCEQIVTGATASPAVGLLVGVRAFLTVYPETPIPRAWYQTGGHAHTDPGPPQCGHIPGLPWCWPGWLPCRHAVVPLYRCATTACAYANHRGGSQVHRQNTAQHTTKRTHPHSWWLLQASAKKKSREERQEKPASWLAMGSGICWNNWKGGGAYVQYDAILCQPFIP